ncbi:MAG: isoleucine--tRNA ligase [Chloroflexi bacterium]|nr:isoleucine--tRNA ligase [Chloroflexota bacterium]
MFKEVPSKVNFPEMEEGVLRFWKENKIFEKSLEIRQDAPRYVFYEGPPTANGLPGTHHVLARVFKDLFPRYKTMQGYYVLRKGGWDTHGLPVELEVEEKLNLNSKQAIEDYGVAEFNAKCRESVFRYVREWEELTDRIGFWIDMEDPYVTLKNEYIESVWWILKQFWNKDLIYQGYRVVPYCPRCGTPLSDHEVALGYDEAEDPSIFVKFPLRDEPGTYFLVWTTTPWTLPGNVALAAHPQIEYVVVEQGREGEKERLILAKELLDEVLEGPYEVVRSVPGKELVGMHYKPLFTFLPVAKDYCYVVPGDFVTTKEGTGIVHIAPAFGADDLEVGQEYNLPVLHTVDLRGAFIDEVTPWRGLFVKDADPLIVEDLEGRELMYKVGTYRHVYPFCWRCDTPLLYYAKATWYIETTRYRNELVSLNRQINWYPEHIRDGRFGNWLENNVDWALGRERYWGTPLPVWVCEECGQQECVGSVDELKSKAQSSKFKGWDFEQLDLHRPCIDEVTYKCEECGGTMRRVPEVIDAWFDSGSMPVAQWHYPFANREMFEAQFPADFICEAVDQTRGWFYSLHAISTLLFNRPCYRNCVCLGLILDAEGEKMSKSRGNVVDPWTVINAHGADALRWYLYTATPPGNDRRFSVELVGEVIRTFMLTLWNVYSFFVTYANLDYRDWRLEVGTKTAGQLLQGAESDSNIQLQASSFQPLDRWILSELHLLVQRVSAALDNYDVTGAARPFERFVEDLSNWYVRRSRRRFWKGEEDEDKAAAYSTLYECLTTLARLLAPFMPFIAEEMYQNLVRSVDETAPESVHLGDYPQADEARIDEQLVEDTRLVMRLVSLGHGARNQAGIKLRQPLAQALFKVRSESEAESLHRLADQVLDELNVKGLVLLEDAGQVVDYRVSPVAHLLGKKYGALFPKIRAALTRLDPAELAQRLRAGETVALEVEEQTVNLMPEELEVRIEAKEGYAVAEEAGYLAAVSVALDKGLIQEGLARELVRRIQTMRKDAGFRIEDRIVTYYQASPALRGVLEVQGQYIKGETLSTKLIEGELPAEAATQTFAIEGEEISLGLVKV